MKINIKDKEGKEHSCWFDYEEWKHQQEWYSWREYIMFKYPPGLLFQNPRYRVPDREGEIDSFENWKLNGESSPKLFNYGTLIKDEVSEEFKNMIMSK